MCGGTNAGSTSLTCLLSGLARVLHFTNLVPLALSIPPHVRKGDIVFFENLNESVRLSTDLALHLRLEIWELAHVDLFATLGSCLALFFILSEVCTIFVLTGQIPRKCSNLLVLCSDNNIAILIVGDRPDCLGKLNGLLAFAISPEFDCAIVTTGDNLSRFKTINTKDEAIVSLKVHHVSAIHGPELDDFIVRD